MSCGNRFQCGITRFQKHSFTPDKPSNAELHNENQKRLSDLLKAREDIDKQFFATTKSSEQSVMTIYKPEETTNNTVNTVTNTNYTPWSTPQGGQYSAFNPK
jgi:hypothetical protein